ncbi:energy transducer TonB [Elstera cyanobacteriorum]|uniref:energy transducer TonB n=1 Tax=Elstera cyanobacteriorum TaxID=2022747 RepID=UPI00235727E6|nr:energy transducer TonB [Elstera cyanobacteriorum]MCK6443222.1 TonB family protein [Elstera cyanobacteriorum]
MTERTSSRLARGLGPLGVVGSLLLHAAVLAAVLQAPLPRDAVPPPAPRVTVALVALAPSPVEPAPQADSPPSPAPAATQEAAQATPDPLPVVPQSAALPAPKPRPVKSAPRSAPPVPAPVAAAPAMAPGASTEIAAAAPVIPEPSIPGPPAPVHLTAPTFRHRPAPAYPAQAQRDEIEGTVRLKLLIGADGRVAEVSLLRSSGHRLLDQAALSAARAWVLEPAHQNGTPTPAWAEVEVPFRLTD